MRTRRSSREPTGPPRITVWVARFAACALLLAACGDGDTASPPDDPPAGTEAGDAGTDAPGGSGVDDDVQQAFDEVVSQRMPGVDIELVQAAKDDGRVVYYTSTNLANNEIAQSFGQDFPFITVEHIQLAGGSLNERFAAEQSSGTHAADVFNTSSEPGVLEFVELGYCEEYTPTVDASYPDEAKVQGLHYRWGGTEQGIAYVQGSLDDEELAALSTWEGLLDERFNDEIFGWIDVAAGGTTVFVNTFFYQEYGADFWRDHQQLVAGTNIYGGTNPTTAALLQGEIDITGPVGISAPYDIWAEGAPIAWIVPTPTLAVPTGGCMAQNPPNPSAAALLWEYILSDHGQTLMAPYGMASYKSDIGTVELPEDLTAEPWYQPSDLSQIVEIPEAELAELREEVIDEWRAVFGDDIRGDQ